jgi:hypothetical protein
MSYPDAEIQKAKMLFMRAEELARYDDKRQCDGRLTTVHIREYMSRATGELLAALKVRLED